MKFSSPFPSSIAFAISCQKDFLNTESLISSSILSEIELKHTEQASSQKRKIEFALGRHAAKKALLLFSEEFDSNNNFSAISIPRGLHREPLWPNNITGSISHAGDFAVAAVGSNTLFAGIGVDIESTTKNRNIKTFERVLHEEERICLYNKKTSESEKIQNALCIFSAKEACYKAFYSAMKVKLGFQDVSFQHIDEKTLLGTLQRTISNEEILLEKGFTFNASLSILNAYIISGICLERKALQ